MSVVATGAQSFEQRFPGKRRRHDEDLPPILQWRCNLTGLSQEHNLYFVAYGADIYVYNPTFPTQSVPQQPVLIVTSQPSSDDLRGYIDPVNPHAINFLIVQHFGKEEIVAVVRDDGDFDAWYVRHLVQAIARRAEPGNSLDVNAREVKHFIQRNVGSSAWGLAVHTDARIIAVSSNNHDVQIFKFGLHIERPEEDNDNNDGTAGSAHQDHERARDVTNQIINGDSNIPYISFCNTGDDPNARWLLTTDISGFCRIMDLRTLQADQVFRFGQSQILRYTGGFDRLNAGWALMFLDRRSFVPESSVQAALGLPLDDSYSDLLPGIRDDTTIWDLSKTVSRVPDAAPAFVRYRQTRRPPTVTRAAPGARTQRRQLSSRASQEDTEPAREVQADLSTTQLLPSREEERSEADGSDSDSHISDGSNNDMSDVIDATDTDEPDDIEYSMPFPDVHDDSEDEGTEDTIRFSAIYSGRRICGNRPDFMNRSALCEGLPCPILHASIRNVYLLQPSSRLHPHYASPPPMVGLANPLEQELQFDDRNIGMFERLNMNAYIPSLGIVVLASQKGRVIVLRLTKLSPSVRYPPELREQGFKTNYAMRVEAILPFGQQEKANQRPCWPLHGIATGPIQGTEGLSIDKKRWRLLLMYQDHSILSYEIRRHSDTAAVTIEETVVV